MVDAYTQRIFANKSGKTFDALQLTKPYAEDLEKIRQALEFGQLGVLITLLQVTTVARDAIANKEPGMVIWNTTNTQLEVWNGSSWDAVQTATAFTTVEILGSSFGGTEGDSGRSYTHSVQIPSDAFVFLGGKLLKSSAYVLSTSVVTDDTITINKDVWNDDEVTIRK